MTAQVSANSPETQKLTGNWQGLRSELVRKGICLDAVYTGEMVSNLSGGLIRRSNYLDIIDFMLALELDRVVPWIDSKVFLDILGTHGRDPGECFGDFQGVSNIAAPNTWKIYEFWCQQNVFNNKFSVLIGMYDLNTDFDVLQIGGHFLNSSHGMGAEFAQSGKNGPSTFPSTALTLRLKTRLNDHLSVLTAVSDGVPDEPNGMPGVKVSLDQQDGALFTAEIAYTLDKDKTAGLLWPSKRRQMHRKRRGYGYSKRWHRKLNHGQPGSRKPGRRAGKNRYALYRTAPKVYRKFAIGGWYYSSDFTDFALEMHPGSSGIYLLWEQSVFWNTKNPDQALSHFLRFGIADAQVNQIDCYLGGGIVYSGIYSGIHQDQIGFALAAAHQSDKFREARLKNGQIHKQWEIALELSYRAEINQWLSIQPDAQYIINPGFNPALNNALSMGIRTEICF